MTKEQLRLKMRELRRNISHEFICDASDEITKNTLSFIDKPDVVMVYLSAFNEPETSNIINYLISENIKIVVPISNTEDNTLSLSYITDMDNLKKGAYGIYEPIMINQAFVDEIDIALIPGIAFSKNGDRLGFGKGYYDKFLSDFKGIKIGLCYDFQICDEIPVSSHDIKMDAIITEKRIYNDF